MWIEYRAGGLQVVKKSRLSKISKFEINFWYDFESKKRDDDDFSSSGSAQKKCIQKKTKHITVKPRDSSVRSKSKMTYDS